MERTLVTGGAGFIGSHLVDRLLAQGEQVVVLDDLSTGFEHNLDPRAELIVADIADEAALASAMDGCDTVVHLAAMVSVQDCIRDWQGGIRANLAGTVSAMQAANAAGNLPVIYASSAAIYGDRGGRNCAETDLPAPISPYGADKLGAEHHARAMNAIHGLPSVGLRFFNVYGPRQNANSPYAGVISKFCKNRQKNRDHVIFGDGTQARDFIYVGDIVDGIIAARRYATADSGASVFNLCTGRATDLKLLAEQIDAVAGRGQTPINYAAARSGDIHLSLGSVELAHRSLGFSAQTRLEQGLSHLWLSLE
ncbi:NAD-dependent epimerase/dehydratase family protein [Paracoccus benzoatiresistens]|uniref:NAD-dependent epimerase/dehydratase family protein n=1 Tax=Paracoccus benzoatiresistens TaxID=2997341 RepID=A0ABT4JBY9_9RHOB|nr:NAD-dependent epimerase/dehydratase family protein [Paracoccus sp. EF6]MCZ0963986.1 NAD-dependent epimerase/dehydratase family protein [Paracoccus sp. EF6]